MTMLLSNKRELALDQWLIDTTVPLTTSVIDGHVLLKIVKLEERKTSDLKLATIIGKTWHVYDIKDRSDG